MTQWPFEHDQKMTDTTNLNDWTWASLLPRSMDDSSNGRAVALYLAEPGSNPRSGSVWDYFVSSTCIDGCIMSDK